MPALLERDANERKEDQVMASIRCMVVRQATPPRLSICAMSSAAEIARRESRNGRTVGEDTKSRLNPVSNGCKRQLLVVLKRR